MTDLVKRNPSNWRASTETEAWMAFFVSLTVVTIKGATSAQSIKISQFMHGLNMFPTRGDNEVLFHELRKKVAMAELGYRDLIDGSLSFVHVDSRETLFMLCMELAITEGTTAHKTCIDYIGKALQIDQPTQEFIYEACKIRTKRDKREPSGDWLLKA